MARSPGHLESTNFMWRGNWHPGVNYYVNDAVSAGDKSYICVSNHVGQQPPDLQFWNVLAAGGQPQSHVLMTYMASF